MRWALLVLLVAVVSGVGDIGVSRGQSQPPSVGDETYYDFWPGRWHRIEGGVVDEEPTFVVRRSINSAAFLEDWVLVVDGVADPSFGLRAWDPAARRWTFVWTNRGGLFQIWDGVKVGNDWYIQRAFDQNGQRFLSRQAWIPEGPNHFVRVMERSTDEGQTWVLRSRTRFVRSESSAARPSAAD